MPTTGVSDLLCGPGAGVPGLAATVRPTRPGPQSMSVQRGAVIMDLGLICMTGIPGP